MRAIGGARAPIRRGTLAALACGGALLVCGTAPAVAVTLTRGPYLQLLTAHSVTVVWNTDGSAPCALAIRPLDGTPTEVLGETSRVCAVTVEGLRRGAAYAYVPRANGVPLDGESIFRTDDPTRPFTFLVLGDSGSGGESQRAVADAMLATPADFVLHTGDMIYGSGAAADFNPKFFTPYANLIRRLVLWPCLGNHDWTTASGQPWRDAFYTPANNPARSENYYSFDFGNAHVAVLNSNASTSAGGAQYEFLGQDLGASDALWKFVAFHHPIYSSSRHGSDGTIRADLVPLFDKHRVDIVFMGHDHNYERTKPLRNDAVVAPGAGTVYITTGGGGGKSLYGSGKSYFTEYSESSYHFTRVTVAGGMLREQMIRADGAVRDSMTIVKDETTTTTRPPGQPPRR